MTQRAEIFRCRICDNVWNQYIQDSKYRSEDICAHCSSEIEEVLRDFELADLTQHLSQSPEERETDHAHVHAPAVPSDISEFTDEPRTGVRKGES